MYGGTPTYSLCKKKTKCDEDNLNFMIFYQIAKKKNIRTLLFYI